MNITEIRRLAARNCAAGLIAQAAVDTGATVDQLPSNPVEWGEGRVWSQVARAAGCDTPNDAVRAEVRHLLGADQ
jgi:hypothetical protein